jgi:hypothetical protein
LTMTPISPISAPLAFAVDTDHQDIGVCGGWLGLLPGRLLRQRGDRAPHRQREYQNGSAHHFYAPFT